MWDFIKFVFSNLLNQNEGKLAAILDAVSEIKQKQEAFIMATEQQYNDVVGRISAVEPKVKETLDAQTAQIVALQEQIKGLGLPASVEDSILEKLNNHAAFLEALITPAAPPAQEPPAENPPATPAA